VSQHGRRFGIRIPGRTRLGLDENSLNPQVELFLLPDAPEGRQRTDTGEEREFAV